MMSMTPRAGHTVRVYRRALAWLTLAAALAILVACRDAERAQPRGELALTEAGYTLRLRYPAGQRPATEARFASDLILPGCDETQPVTITHTEVYQAARDLELAPEALPAELAPLRGVVAAMVRETYRLATLYPPTVRDQVELTATVGERQTRRLYWYETWDENWAEVWLNGQLVGETPVRILTQVELVAEAGEAAPCDQIAADPENGVPLILALGRPLGATPSPMPAEVPVQLEPEPDATVCPPPAPTTPAQHLVVRYLQLLHARDHAAAYDMLAESYRLRLPFPQYQAGYEPVRAIVPCSLETIEVAGAFETVYATLRIALESQGITRDELWIARYQVRGAGRDGAPGVITSVSMFRAALRQD